MRPGRVRQIGIAFAAVAIALASIASSRALPARAVTIDPCSYSPCVTIHVGLYRNGTGNVVTDDPSTHVADGIISCQRTWYVSSGTCSHGYRIDPGGTISIELHYVATAGSSVCYADGTLIGGTQYFSDQYTAAGDYTVTQWDFCLTDTRALTVTHSGTGSGVVTSDPVGIECGLACSLAFPHNGQVTLTATPNAGSTFGAWSGACAGQGNPCVLTMGSDLLTDARYDKLATPTPSPRPTHTAKPSATPTRPPTASPTPGPTSITPRSSLPAGASPASSPGAAGGSPTVGGSPAASAKPTIEPGPTASAGAGAPAGSASGGDGMTILLVLVGGIAIGLGVAVAGFVILRRRAP